MWDRDLVSRLSPKASQVLLSLLLSRSQQVQYSSAEFAQLTGLGQRSIAPALFELRSFGLIDIIPQPGKPPVVGLVHPEEMRYETTIVETAPDSLAGVEAPALLVGGTADHSIPVGSGGGNEGTERAGGKPALPAGDEREKVQALLDACSSADESQDKELRVAALQDVWEYAFPFKDYPVQRLSNDAAKRLLVNRSSEWVAGVILDAVKNAKSKIGSPRAYIERAVSNQEERQAKRGGVVEEVGITDDLRNLARLGREQFGAKNKDSGGYQSGAS